MKQSFWQSLIHASQGFLKVVKEERNLQIHIIVSIFVMISSLILKIKFWEFIIVFLVCIIIIVLELLNTVFEKFIDFIKPQMHSYVKILKDLMAATVLVAAFGSVVIGLLIFGPYVWKFLF